MHYRRCGDTINETHPLVAIARGAHSNAVPAGDILKDSQWGGITHSHLGGDTIDQALATLSFIVDKEGATGVPMFFNLSDSWASIAMQSWDISTLNAEQYCRESALLQMHLQK